MDDDQLPGTSSQRPGTRSQRPGTSSERPGTSSERPGTSSGRPGTSSERPGTSSGPPGTSSERPGTSSQRPGTSSKRPGTSSKRPGTRSQRPGTSSERPGTSSQRPGTSSERPGTSSEFPETSFQLPETSLERKLCYQEMMLVLNKLDHSNVEDCRIKINQALDLSDKMLGKDIIEDCARNPMEAYVGSQLFRTTCLQLKKSCEASRNSDFIYDKAELASYLREHPDFLTFLFPLEIDPVTNFDPTSVVEKPKKVRKKVERQKTAALKRPLEIQSFNQPDENSQIIMKIGNYLTKTFKETNNKPISYYHLVLDADSFSRTIENIYYLSFLARDSIIMLKVDEKTKLPFVLPAPKQSEHSTHYVEDENSINIRTAQFVVSLNVESWKELVRALLLTTPKTS